MKTLEVTLYFFLAGVVLAIHELYYIALLAPCEAWDRRLQRKYPEPIQK